MVEDRKVDQEFKSLIMWVASPPEIAKKMLEFAQVGPEDIVYDLGCGDARILIMAVQEFGAKKAVGYEIRQDLVEKSLQEIQSQNLEDRITIIRDDLLNADLSEASVIALYLVTSANEILRPKLEEEAKSETRIISRYFEIKSWQAASNDSESQLYL